MLNRIVTCFTAWFVAAILFPAMIFAGGAKVTEAHLDRVHAAYLEAQKAGFSREAIVKLYTMPDVPDVASAIKKLVDLHQSDPKRSISPADSAAMETARQAMNMEVLQHLAMVTGGTIEVMDAGKQNGIRSDKDLMIFGVVDGNRTLSATQMKKLYEDTFKTMHGIDLERMDMTIFDGDALIPDWRRTSMSFHEFVEAYKKGQAKLEENPGAVREAGTWRQGAELRYATNSRVTLVKHRKFPDDKRVLPLINKNETRQVRDAAGDTQHFEVIENAHVTEASARYQAWKADVPYRNAMDAAYEWRWRHNHSTDFVDKMKYFNRTVGDGINALAIDGWDKNYIFHLASLKSPEEVRAYIKQVVEDVYVVDASAEMREHFTKVIELSARIELDKMRGQSKGEAEYLKPIMDVVRKNAESKGEKLSDADALSRARETFFGWHQQVMNYNLMATTRQKLRMDLADPKRRALLIEKYTSEGHDGVEEVKKLEWETWRQAERIINGIEDEKLVARLIDDAPAELKPHLQEIHEAAKLRRSSVKREEKQIKHAKSDPAEAAKTGPQELELERVPESHVEKLQKQAQELADRVKQKYADFRADAEAGKYSDEAITQHLRERAMDALGYEDRVVLNKMQVEYEQRFSGSKLLKNALDLGNVNSLITILRVYQETGDMEQVAATALWEIVSNIPGVSQAATLRQAFNDGDVSGLTFLFFAWQVPAAGHVKLVFDVASGTMTLIYNHAMDPLKDDRFSQVYMGYVDAQPAGWSPLKPGWKERRDAAGLSIFHFVPGKTFEEKRTNMYEYHHGRLDAKLQANGIKPTQQEYHEKYEQIIEPYFRKYVTDYFNAAGEWSENTTVGLKAVGTQEELKERMIKQLIRDFKQGEANFEKLKEVREKMADAVKRMEDVTRARVSAEKTLAGTQSFLAGKFADAVAASIKRAEQATAQAAQAKPVIKVMAFPPVVSEGQKASVVVRATSAVAGPTDKPHVIEIKRIDRTAAAGVTSGGPISAENARKELEEDAVFAKEMVAGADAATKSVRLATIEYEVTVRNAVGAVLDTRRVKVRLLGEETAVTGTSGVTVKTRWWSKVEEPKGKTGNTFADEMVSYASKVEDYKPEKVTPFNIGASADTGGNTNGGDLLLWVTWPKFPPQKSYWYEVTVSGGLPKFEKTHARVAYNYTLFEERDGQKPAAGGPCFTLAPPFPVGSAGSFKITGRLLAYDKYTASDTERRKLKPSAEFPFTADFEVPNPPHTATGVGSMSPYGVVQASIAITNVQDGKRPARVSIGGREAWVMMIGTGLKSTGQYDLHVSGIQTDGDASKATITFEDFGRPATVTADLAIKPPSKRETFKSDTIAASRKRIDELMKKEQENFSPLISEYLRIAQSIRYQDQHRVMTKEYVAAREKQYDYMDRWIAVEKKPDSLATLKMNRLYEIKAGIMDLHEAGDVTTQRAWVARAADAAAAVTGQEAGPAAAHVGECMRQHAHTIFRTTGDVAAARVQWQNAIEFEKKRPNLPLGYVPPAFPYDPDPGFSK